MFHARSQGSYDIGYGGDTTGDDWPRRMLNGVRLYNRANARLGHKYGLTRLWAKKGTRPRQPADQRYGNAYLYGAICPAHGKGAALNRSASKKSCRLRRSTPS